MEFLFVIFCFEEIFHYESRICGMSSSLINNLADNWQLAYKLCYKYVGSYICRYVFFFAEKMLSDSLRKFEKKLVYIDYM